MYEFLDRYKLICSQQFEFRAGHSTSHALIFSIEYIKSCIDAGNYIGGMFIDLQKAFDTVNHDIFCDKLAYFGLAALVSYLLNLIWVTVNNTCLLMVLNPLSLT